MKPRITVCGLGPGRSGLVTVETRSLLSSAAVGHLRTRRHPSADLAPGFESFDHLYQQAQRFDDVYDAIVEALIAGAHEYGHVVYAVPGSPLVLERSVRHLLAFSANRDDSDTASAGDDRSVEVVALPAVSFLDEVWARLAVDPVDDGVRLVDGHRFAAEAADQRGPLLVAHAHSNRVLSDIKLALDAGPEQRVVILQGLGTEHERVVEVGWPDLDRTIEADHLTSLYLPELAAPVGRDLADAVELMATLRTSCPWDRAQDHASLRPYLVEETAEALDALDAVVLAEGADEGDLDDAYWELERELGDVLFQLLFHARLASEAGRFGFGDVARTLVDKMVHRHPHVFGDSEYDPASWASLKNQEKAGWDEPPTADRSSPQRSSPQRSSAQRSSAQRSPEAEPSSPFDGVPAALPSLARANKLLRRAVSHGLTPDLGSLEAAAARLVSEAEAVTRIGNVTAEEPGGSESGSGVGLALLALVELGRRSDVEPEGALGRTLQVAVARHAAQRGDDGQIGERAWVLG